MTPNRRLTLLLGLLGAAVIALIANRDGVSNLWPVARLDVGVGAADPGVASEAAPRGPAFPDVNLEGLAAGRVEPVEGGRNPFSMSTAPRTAFSGPPPALGTPGPTGNSENVTDPATRTVPPIPLKFIGIVNLSRDRGRLAVLSDGDFVYHGRHGDIVEGRYRILNIGDESIELEYTDGRGRQSLPLAGS